MTRFLSEALQAPEPFFRMGLRELEAASGHPSHDIRLSTEVMRAARSKIPLLGLDPHDTTAPELYHALLEKAREDDAILVKNLRTLAATHISAEGDLTAGMVHALKELPESTRGFALKTSKLKSLLKQHPPRKAMKRLGYRSVDSMLKHEPPVSILAAAKLVEGSQWQKSLLDSYKKLRSSDFEDRGIVVLSPSSKHWQDLAGEAVFMAKHNLVSLKELASLVILPLPKDAPAGSTLASLSLALYELNDIRAGSAYLKLSQVRPDFGQLVASVSAGQPIVHVKALNTPAPWHLLTRYLSQLKLASASFLDDPHLGLEDLSWHSVEQSLQKIEPKLDFWQGSSHLALLNNKEPVSLNVVDAVLSACNNLPFESRLSDYCQKSLWHELLMRYLSPEAIKHTILEELQPKLAEELVEV